MFAAVWRWILHCKQLSNRWWAVIALVWSAFSGLATAIDLWGSTATKAEWKALTLHFPFGWQTWLIGLLVIVLVLVYDASYRHTKRLNFKIMGLSWPENRPQILFDSWGEIPPDHPEVRSFERQDSSGKYLEYFQRGFHLSNQGGTAHEITCFPIELAESVYAFGNVVPRIDKESQGFMLVYMDIEHNAKFMEETERWDLLNVMGALEKKIKCEPSRRNLDSGRSGSLLQGRSRSLVCEFLLDNLSEGSEPAYLWRYRSDQNRVPRQERIQQAIDARLIYVLHLLK